VTTVSLSSAIIGTASLGLLDGCASIDMTTGTVAIIDPVIVGTLSATQEDDTSSAIGEPNADPFSSWARVFHVDDVTALGLANGDEIPLWACRGQIGTSLTKPSGAASAHRYAATGGPVGGPCVDGGTTNISASRRGLRAHDGLIIAQPFTVAAVHSGAASANRINLCGDGDVVHMRTGTGTVYRYQINAGSLLTDDGPYTATDWRVAVFVFNGPSSEVWMNGVLTAAGEAGVASLVDLQIGGQWDWAATSADRWAFLAITEGLEDPEAISAALNAEFSIY
jgi:hypothetical protein